MRIAIGSDHAGFKLKKKLIAALSEMGCDYEDMGCYDEIPVDYPDVAIPLAKAVAEGRFEKGILICSNGVGVSICANKIRGIRAALCSDTFTTRRAREHADANILCLGGWTIGQGVAREILQVFLNTDFAGGRHSRRLKMIEALEGSEISS
ncbi:MAG: RpiB [Dehalococcoidia bacterium]|nr:RpiB [Dehalococcoidia bacterium]